MKITKIIEELIIRLRRLFKGSAYYVGGSELLPAPLTKEDELLYLSYLDIPDKREEAKKVLTEHNLRLVVYISKKFENTGINVEDLVSIGSIGLIKSINTFKNDKKIKLATYASRCIENEILMYLRKNSNNRTEISIDEPLNVDWDGNELLLSDVLGTDDDIISRAIEEKTDNELLKIALMNLSDKERNILELRFGIGRGGKEMTQKEVADLLGISQSYISRLEKKIIGRLRKDMDKMINEY